MTCTSSWVKLAVELADWVMAATYTNMCVVLYGLCVPYRRMQMYISMYVIQYNAYV